MLYKFPFFILIVIIQKIMTSTQQINPPLNRNAKQTQSSQSVHHGNLQKLHRSVNVKSSKGYGQKLRGYMHVPQKYLNKNKKYYRKDSHQNQKENIIRNDIENIMQGLARQKIQTDYILVDLKKNYDKFIQNSRIKHSSKCPLTIAKKYNSNTNNLLQHCSNSKIKQKISLQNQKDFFTKNDSSMFESKQIKKELKHYISKMRTYQEAKSNSYKDYLKLTQQSYDYLEYYLKATSYLTQNFNSSPEEIENLQQILKTSNQKLLLSSLRSNYKCLQIEYNHPDVINRILLAFNINPLNQFQFISKETFYKIRRLICGQFNTKQAKQFMANYTFLRSKQVKREQVDNVFAGIFKKLSKVTSFKAIQLFLQRIKVFSTEVITNVMSNYRRQKAQQLAINFGKSIFTRQNYKDMLDNDPLFLFQEVIELIFIV